MDVTSLATDLGRRNAVLSMAFLPLLLSLLTVRYFRSPWRKLPPGPRGLPLLGNLHQIAHGKYWVTLAKWSKIYGPILYLNAGGQPMIVLGSLKVATDLLDRRSSIYSDRPNNIVASDMMTGGMSVPFIGFNDLFKRMRKASHETLKKSVATEYQPMQLREASVLTENLLTNGKDWNGYFDRAAASFIMSLVYGMPTHSSGDPTVVKIRDYSYRILTAALPGTYLVEFFPWMQYIPARFAGWKRNALELFEEASELFQKLLDGALERKATGDDRPTMATKLIQDTPRTQLSHLECSFLAATMYAAGTEAISSVMSWWLLAMLVYPDTQKRAQEEIDRVVGRDRLPTFADMNDLPYIQAMVKELVRWSLNSPVALPHRLTEDDWYNGYFIPKGSIVVANLWAISRDPAIFGDDASHFNPARYLDDKGQVAPAPPDTKEEGHIGYGFGRRICVGRYVANNCLFIYIAAILWAMNIERAKDEKGNLVPLDAEEVVYRGVIVRKKPFECKFVPRSPDVLSILEGVKES